MVTSLWTTTLAGIAAGYRRADLQEGARPTAGGRAAEIEARGVCVGALAEPPTRPLAADLPGRARPATGGCLGDEARPVERDALAMIGVERDVPAYLSNRARPATRRRGRDATGVVGGGAHARASARDLTARLSSSGTRAAAGGCGGNATGVVIGDAEAEAARDLTARLSLGAFPTAGWGAETVWYASTDFSCKEDRATELPGRAGPSTRRVSRKSTRVVGTVAGTDEPKVRLIAHLPRWARSAASGCGGNEACLVRVHADAGVAAC